MPVFSFKTSHDEALRIRANARAAKAPSVSAYLRRVALGDEAQHAKIIRKKHAVSGLPYNAAPGKVVTDEEIRAALADFP